MLGVGSVTELLEVYGWYIVISLVTILYLYSKFSSYINKGKSTWSHSSDYRQYDSDEVLRRQEAVDAARRRLQEQHEAMAQKYLEEQKKKEGEKRKQKIEDWNRHLEGKGYRSKVKSEEPAPPSTSAPSSSSSKKKNVYRNADYSPLAGESGGACFRPPRRNPRGG